MEFIAVTHAIAQTHTVTHARRHGSHDHGARGRSSRAALLSGAASSSITCGSASVPAAHVALMTVKAESAPHKTSSVVSTASQSVSRT